MMSLAASSDGQAEVVGNLREAIKRFTVSGEGDLGGGPGFRGIAGQAVFGE